MKITMFQSAQGDCLLLSNATRSARILVDGGMPHAYRSHVAAPMAKLRQSKKRIDLVYVSHIDEDHIGGVLAMMDDEVAWRVHEHQLRAENPSHPPPSVPRPARVDAIWHNSFFDQLEENARPIEEALAASAPILRGADLQKLRDAGSAQARLATSIRQAIQLSRRIGPRQLGIPLNAPAGGKLMMRRDGQAPVSIGGMSVTILGPTAAHLTKLRSDWNTWLRANEAKVEALREAAREDERRLGASEFERFIRMMNLRAEAFGNPKSVTPPNLASLTLLVEEGGRSALLTGDARWDQIVEGLEAAGKLAPGGRQAIHVVKVPHHGSRHNVVETTLLDRVIGTHYLFCGNGESGNPHPDVVELMARRRLAADGKFKFWFNSSADAADKPRLVEHMAELEKLVRRLARASKGRMRYAFLRKGSLAVTP